MTPLISIIVPVYNAENYLVACVTSIRQQTLTEVEIILVNDGSTDSSGKICDELASCDGRVVVIHKQNAGVSAARNDGLAVAKGKYIGFVDADDTIAPDMYHTLYEEATRINCDIVMCDAVTVYPDGRLEDDTISLLPNNKILKKGEIQPNVLLQLSGSACRCIYRTALILRHAIQFPVGHKFSEDRIFNILCMGYANKLSYLKIAFYHRLIHAASAVHRFHADYYEHVRKAHFSSLHAISLAWNGNLELLKSYGEHFVSGAYSAINNYFYKTSDFTLKQKINAIRNICCDTSLQQVIIDLNRKDLRAVCIRKKWCLVLAIVAKILNLKHNR